MAELAAGLSLAGTALNFFGSQQKSQAATQVGNYNAAADETAALNTEAAAGANAAQIAQNNTRTQSSIAAAYGAAGVEGSTPLGVMQDAAIQGELTRQLVLWQGKTQATALRQKAVIDRAAGASAATAADTQGMTTLLTAAGNFFGPNGAGNSLLPSRA